MQRFGKSPTQRSACTVLPPPLSCPWCLFPPLGCRTAPEVLIGGSGCTLLIDLYSFGVLLWEASSH